MAATDFEFRETVLFLGHPVEFRLIITDKEHCSVRVTDTYYLQHFDELCPYYMRTTRDRVYRVLFVPTVLLSRGYETNQAAAILLDEEV